VRIGETGAGMSKYWLVTIIAACEGGKRIRPREKKEKRSDLCGDSPAEFLVALVIP